jgi:hypothetical protein
MAKTKVNIDIYYTLNSGSLADSRAKKILKEFLFFKGLGKPRLLEQGSGFCFLNKERDISFCTTVNKSLPRNIVGKTYKNLRIYIRKAV